MQLSRLSTAFLPSLTPFRSGTLRCFSATNLTMKRRLTTPEEHAAKRLRAAKVADQHPQRPRNRPPRRRLPKKGSVSFWSSAKCAAVAESMAQELQQIADSDIAAQQSMYVRHLFRKLGCISEAFSCASKPVASFCALTS